MNEQMKNKLLSKDKWLRAVFIAFFWCISYALVWLVLFIATFQFLWNLFTDTPNEKLGSFTHNLNTYYHQIMDYLTFNTVIKPFPFSHWPKSS